MPDFCVIKKKKKKPISVSLGEKRRNDCQVVYKHMFGVRLSWVHIPSGHGHLIYFFWVSFMTCRVEIVVLIVIFIMEVP